MGFTGSLMAAPCLKGRYGPEKTRTYCTLSMRLGRVADLSSLERARRASLWLARGRAQAELGETAAARADFREALLRAAEADDGPLPLPDILSERRVLELFAAMRDLPAESPAYLVWLETLRDVSCPHPRTSVPLLCDGA